MPSKEWYEKNKEKQQQYNKEYAKNNPERTRYLRARTSARSFIRTKSTLEDIDELRELLNQREEKLLNEKEELKDK